MTKTEIIFALIAVFFVIISLIVILVNRHSTKKILLSMNNMLDEAINGIFNEKYYDESLMSAVEAKLANYLSSSMVSSQNLKEEKNKIKELISDISHQTKTPIANILLYSELLSEQENGMESGNLVNELNTQAKKLSFLISSLVKTSRLESGVLTLNPKENSILNLVENSVGEAKSKAEKKSIDIIYDKEDILALFDMKWTSEALYNIIDNAIKYTPVGGKIVVSMVKYNLFARIDIKDNGIGIAQDDLTEIFKRFYRSPSVGDMEGVGIGLYLSREIVAGQGGYIKVASNKEKETVFSVFLPCLA